MAGKVGPLGIVVLMTTALALLAWAFREQVLYVLSGKLFGSQWCRTNFLGLNRVRQPIGVWYFLATVLTVAVIFYAVVVRWLTDRSTKLGYWVFVVLTSLLCLVPIIILTVPFYWMLIYIHNMGFTQMRIYGLLYGLGGYIIILGFLYWATKIPCK